MIGNKLLPYQSEVNSIYWSEWINKITKYEQWFNGRIIRKQKQRQSVSGYTNSDVRTSDILTILTYGVAEKK